MNPAPHRIGNLESEKLRVMEIESFFMKVIYLNPAPQRGAKMNSAPTSRGGMNTKGGAG